MIAPWACRKMVRAAYLAGVVAGQADATLGDAQRSVRISLGETGALPMVRDASKNRPIGAMRYADVSAWGISLVHTPGLRLAPNEEVRRTLAVAATRELMQPRNGAVAFLARLRAGSVFHGETDVRDRVGLNGRLLADMADVVIAEIAKINTAADIPLGPFNLTINGAL